MAKLAIDSTDTPAEYPPGVREYLAMVSPATDDSEMSLVDAAVNTAISDQGNGQMVQVSESNSPILIWCLAGNSGVLRTWADILSEPTLVANMTTPSLWSASRFNEITCED